MLAKRLEGDPKPGWVYEPKLDGVRAVAHKENGVVSVYTRDLVEKTDKVPHLESAFAQIPYDFTLDGELIAVEKVVQVVGEQVPIGNFTIANAILGSGSSRAVTSQTNAKLAFVVFDCLAAHGRDLTGMPDILRRGVAQTVVDALQDVSTDIMLVPRWKEANGNGLFEEIVAAGGEGLMVKNPDAYYKVAAPGAKAKRPSNTWYKMKATDTADVVVVCYFCAEKKPHTTHGFKPGEGKYKGQIGALDFGQYKGGKLVARSRCSGMTDAQRRKISDNQEAYLGRVMEVKFFGRTGPERSFRHPNYVRFRDDKKPEECVWE